jgi:ABC-type transport system involved in multi-copper enzyme maturation permease subunit
MTATVSTPRRDTTGTDATLGSLPGFGGLLRKELTEWSRARRTWVVFIISALFMTLGALNTWLQTVLPEEARDSEPVVADPLMILAQSVGAQIFAVVAIFAVMGILVAERENGTLAWTASKPVSRSAIWLSKWVASVGVLWIAAGLIPMAATIALIVVLYGGLPIAPILIMAVGIGLSTLLFITIALTVSTVVTSQAAVAGIALGVMFLPQLLGLLISPEFLPTSILQWSLMLAAGEPVGFTTLGSYVATIVALVAFSLFRMERLEL